METQIKVKLADSEISKINSIQEEITKKKRELAEYVNKLQKDYGLDKTELCILTYRKPVEVDKETRKFMEPRKYEMKEFVRLAYLSWHPYPSLDGFRIWCKSVLTNGKAGNEISLYELEDVAYEILEGYTVEEAKKLLKTIKNDKQSEKAESE